MKEKLIMKMFKHLIILATLILLSAQISSCKCPPGPGDDYTKKIYDKLETPEVTFEVMRVCIANDLINTFYYCLAKDIRDDLSLTILTSAWDEIKEQLKIDPATLKILEITPLAKSPFPPNQAVSVRMEYKNDKGKPAREKMLFVLEQDIEIYEEVNQNWRLYYPYKPYQGYDVKNLTKSSDK
jgi:hypothetical protein